MDPWIDEVKSRVQNIVETLVSDYKNCKVRVDLSSNYRDYESFLKSIKVKGGGDDPEDIN